MSSVKVPSTTPSQRLVNREERKERRLQLLAQRAQEEQILFATVEGEPIVYADVSTTAWYAPYVSMVIEEGIAEGYKDEQGKVLGKFVPAQDVTYAEALKMALEAAGQAENLPTLAPENRTARGTWAAPYVRRAEDLKLSVFLQNPDANAPIPRGAFVQVMMEAFKATIGRTAPAYSDVPKDHPYANAIAAATFFGIVEGDRGPDGTLLNLFRPNDLLDRASAAKIIALMREVLK